MLLVSQLLIFALLCMTVRNSKHAKEQGKGRKEQEERKERSR